MRRRGGLRPALILAVAALGACGGAPQPAPAPPPRVAVLEDPEATALAAAVVVPGSAWELPGTEGLTILSALTLLEQVRPALDALGARAAVQCGPAAFTVTLVAPRDAGGSALELFLDGLFRPDPADTALARARDRLRASLLLDQASPSWQARLAVRRALHEDSLSSGWLGPACGVPETLDFFTLDDVRAGAYRFAPRLAHVAVLAPADGRALRQAVERRIPRGRASSIPAPRTVAAGRRYVERNTITAWVAVAFPFGPDADLEAVRLVGALLQDAVAPSVDRPSSFTAHHELLRHGRGGSLVLQVVTEPAAAAEYADRIEARARAIASGEIPEALYERVARAHRGRRLLELMRPEARAAEAALALALGETPEAWPSVAVDRDRLQAAARALGAPARSVVGPTESRAAVGPQ